MNTIPTLPQHLKAGDKILMVNEIFIVDRFGTDKAKRTFMYCKGGDKILTLEYYKGQIKIDKVIG